MATFPVNVDVGILCAEFPLNTTVADALLASILPVVRLILPFSVSVLAPTVRVPAVKVRSLATVKLWLLLNPALLLRVRLFTLPVNAEAGILWAAEPLKTTVADALLALILPAPRLIVPLRLRVYAPTVNVPAVKVKVLATVIPWLVLKPELLFKVRLLIFPVNAEAGILCAEDPLNTTVADALLASMLPDVRLMLPLRVRVLAPVVRVPAVRVRVLGKIKFLLNVTPELLFIVKDVFEPSVKVPLPLIV
jgi:hypothetical protein